MVLLKRVCFVCVYVYVVDCVFYVCVYVACVRVFMRLFMLLRMCVHEFVPVCVYDVVHVLFLYYEYVYVYVYDYAYVC